MIIDNELIWIVDNPKNFRLFFRQCKQNNLSWTFHFWSLLYKNRCVTYDIQIGKWIDYSHSNAHIVQAIHITIHELRSTFELCVLHIQSLFNSKYVIFVLSVIICLFCSCHSESEFLIHCVCYKEWYDVYQFSKICIEHPTFRASNISFTHWRCWTN